jgi:hypothetical protein
MRDDLLKEELMSYARAAADQASPPAATMIRRRARRHAQRVAALTVTGVLAAVGLAVGIGLRANHTAPTVDQPKPPVTSPTPPVTSPAPGVKPPATTPAPGTTPHPPTTGTVAAGPPPSFVTMVQPATGASSIQPPRIAVVSTSTGQVVRYLTGPPPAGISPSRPALSPDRAWVYYSLSGSGPRTGTYRVPFGGGPATRVTRTVGWSMAVSPDGSKLLLDARGWPGWRYGLVVLDLASGRERFLAFSFPQRGDVFGCAWSPDSRQVALVRGPVSDNDPPAQLFVLDVAAGRWREAASFGTRGPTPEFAERNLAWPAPRKVVFIARFADSDSVPGRYRLVEADPRTGGLTSRPAVLATDPSAGRRVTTRYLDADPSGRYLLYGIDGLSLTTRWVDAAGKRPPVKVAQFDALSASELHAYEAGDW